MPAGACPSAGGRCGGPAGKRFELVAFVDAHRERAENLVSAYGGKAFTSLADVDIDVVTVCTPTDRHGEVAIEALGAGKHVIIEKAAETTVARTDQIIAAQQRAGTQVTVIFEHRFDLATEVAFEAIAKG